MYRPRHEPGPVHLRPGWWMLQGFVIGLTFALGRMLGRFEGHGPDPDD